MKKNVYVTVAGICGTAALVLLVLSMMLTDIFNEHVVHILIMMAFIKLNLICFYAV